MSTRRPWPIGSFLALWRRQHGATKITLYVVTAHRQFDDGIKEAIEPLQLEDVDVTEDYDAAFRCTSCGHIDNSTDDRLYPIPADSILLRLARDREATLHADPHALEKAVELMREASKAV